MNRTYFPKNTNLSRYAGMCSIQPIKSNGWMKKYMIMLVLLSVIVACDKELDQQNPNSLSQSTFWKNDNDFNSALASTYKVFKDVNNGLWGVRGIETSNGRGDDFFIRNDVSDLYQLSTFTNTATTGVPGSLFTGCYTAIFRANQIIENAATSTLSDSSRKQFIAEAKFIRGVNYFTLASNFGAVPIITAVPQNSEQYFTAESPEADVWAQAIKDLHSAKDSLPLSYPADWLGRATRGSAIGYMGKAYIYTSRWAEAEAQFKLLSQPDGQPQAPFTYNLLPNYEDNFVAEKDNNIESLFEVQIQDVGGSNPWAGENSNEGLGVTTAQEFAPTEVAGWFEAFPTDKMLNEFQKEKTVGGDFDPRMYASIVWNYPGAMYYNKPFTEFALTFPQYHSRIRKYQNWRKENDLGNSDYMSNINEKCIRYADVLLMYAEAVTMQGRAADAYPLVKRIRDRANLSALPAGYTQEQMMTEIRHQRMVEFFREGLRFYDLKRWKLLEQEIANSDKEGKENFRAKHYYFPIPQNEINTNPAIHQNPAWQ